MEHRHEPTDGEKSELGDYGSERYSRGENKENKTFRGDDDAEERKEDKHERCNNRQQGGDDDRLEKGTVVQGTVGRIESYGAFVNFGSGRRGLVHISQLAPRFARKVEDIVQLNQRVHAVILEMDPVQHRISLSMQRVNQETGELIETKRNGCDTLERGGGHRNGEPIQPAMGQGILQTENNSCQFVCTTAQVQSLPASPPAQEPVNISAHAEEKEAAKIEEDESESTKSLFPKNQSVQRKEAALQPNAASSQPIPQTTSGVFSLSSRTAEEKQPVKTEESDSESDREHGLSPALSSSCPSSSSEGTHLRNQNQQAKTHPYFCFHRCCHPLYRHPTKANRLRNQNYQKT